MDLMEKRAHYWNGSWGRLARHDVLVYEDGGEWTVENRLGGAEGRSTWTSYASEEAALDATRDLLAGYEKWQQLG
jgi:hypothetical protein